MHTVPLPMHSDVDNISALFKDKIVLTDSPSLMDRTSAKFYHIASQHGSGIGIVRENSKSWAADIYSLSRRLHFDFVYSDKVLKINSIPFDLADNNRVISPASDIASPPMPDHSRWVKNLIKLIGFYGASNISISAPKEYERILSLVPGNEKCSRQLSAASKINLIVYEGDTDFNSNMRVLSSTVVLANKPECLNLYKIQRYGLSFKNSHSGYYRLVERTYEIP